MDRNIGLVQGVYVIDEDVVVVEEGKDEVVVVVVVERGGVCGVGGEGGGVRGGGRAGEGEYFFGNFDGADYKKVCFLCIYFNPFFCIQITLIYLKTR